MGTTGKTIRFVVLEYVRKHDGIVDYEELTDLVLKQFPASKWKRSHWSWYRHQIVRGRFSGEFSNRTIKNLLASMNRSSESSKASRTFTSSRVEVAPGLVVARNRAAEVERDIAVALAKVTHHVHPAIVRKIAEANAEWKSVFCAMVPKAINPDDYLYAGSACVFPGVRRHMDRQGLKKRNCYFQGDDGIIDSNFFPREFWCFLYTGRRYYPSTWKDTGLNQFELAHIFAHKPHERKVEQEVFEHVDSGCKPYGLFTCAANVALIPRGLTKPTDALPSVKTALFRRHIDLYGESNLPGLRGFRDCALPAWYGDLKQHWMEPVLPEKWAQRVDALLDYRAACLRRVFERSRSRGGGSR